MQRLRLFRKPHPAQEIFALDELVEDGDQDVLGDEQHEEQGEGAVPGAGGVDVEVGGDFGRGAVENGGEKIGGQGNGDAKQGHQGSEQVEQGMDVDAELVEQGGLLAVVSEDDAFGRFENQQTQEIADEHDQQDGNAECHMDGQRDELGARVDRFAEVKQADAKGGKNQQGHQPMQDNPQRAVAFFEGHASLNQRGVMARAMAKATAAAIPPIRTVCAAESQGLAPVKVPLM